MQMTAGRLSKVQSWNRLISLDLAWVIEFDEEGAAVDVKYSAT